MASTTINSPIANIQDNIMTLERRSIQISNISQMSVQRKDGKHLIGGGVVSTLLAIFSFGLVGELEGGMIALGIFFLAAAIALFVLYTQRGYYLLLEMNSGANFWLSSRNKQEEAFLLQAKYQLCTCANNNTCGVSIDFSQCTIMNSNVLSDQAVAMR